MASLMTSLRASLMASMACLIREDEPESLISGTLNKVNTVRDFLSQVTGGSSTQLTSHQVPGGSSTQLTSNQVPGGSSTQLTNSCTSDTSTEPSSMATFDSMALRHSVSDTSSASQCAKIFLRL